MLKVLLAALAVLYPALVYFGLAHLRPGVFGVLLVILILLRPGSLPPQERRKMLLPAGIVLAYALTVAVTNSETLLRFYPVLMNGVMLAVFAHTLIEGPPLIERIARARGMAVSAEGRVYVRRVTQLWCVFFVLNGTIAAYTALSGSWEVWVMYNGFIAYLAMGVLFVGEMIFRRWYKARVEVQRQAGE